MDEGDDGYEGDLSKFVDMGRSECLNTEHPIENIFQDNSGTTFLKSDTDEQLLFTIAFKSIVSLKNIKFVAPSDGTGPKAIKLFLNRLNLSFDAASSEKSTQEFKLSPEDLNSDTKPQQLDSVKFVKTDTLTVFIHSNQGDKDHTVLQKIVLCGRKV